MSKRRSRRQIQERLRSALVEELGKMDLPDDGQHLGRVFRALTHAAVELMQSVGIPDPVTAQLMLRVAKKTLKSTASLKHVAGVFGPMPTGKA
jgi:hypothetical protein